MATLNIKEARAYLKIGTGSVYELLKSGEIKAVFLRGRWVTWTEECDAYLRKLAEQQMPDRLAASGK